MKTRQYQRLSREKKLEIYASHRTLVPFRSLKNVDDNRYDPICNWPYNGRCVYTLTPNVDENNCDEHGWQRAAAMRNRGVKFEHAYMEAMQHTHGRRLKGA